MIPASATPFSEAGDDASRAERCDDASHSGSDAESYDVESRSASEGSYDVHVSDADMDAVIHVSDADMDAVVHVSDADMDAVVGAYEEARAALETMTERAAAAERVAADLEASLTGSRLELIAARTKLATVERSLVAARDARERAELSLADALASAADADARAEQRLAEALASSADGHARAERELAAALASSAAARERAERRLEEALASRAEPEPVAVDHFQVLVFYTTALLALSAATYCS